MKSFRPAAGICCSVALAGADAAPVASDGALGIATDMGADAVGTLSAPLRWDAGDWGRLGLAACGLAGAIALDEPVRRFAQTHADGGARTAATWANPMGTYGSFVVLGAFGIEGWAAHDPRGVMALRDGIIATVVAGGIITPALKVAVGRSRPNAGQGAGDVHPFSGGKSFPSGHATQAFAVASVIATTYDDSAWAAPAAYGVACAVAGARIIDNKHWLSDTVAGAVIGTAVGTCVVHLDQRRRIVPVVAVGRDGWVVGGMMEF